MRWLVGLSLRNRIVVVALAALLVVAAMRTLRTTPLDVFPEFAPPLVEVQTEAPGLSTNDVEALVTVPLEAALNGVPGLDRIRSKSVLGLSSVVLVLDPSTDVMRSRQMVQERLSRAAATLPAVARPPVMLSPLSSLSRVMKIGMTSKDLSQVEMSTLAKWTIRPRLMAIPGVANVAIWGQRDRQIQVLVDPSRLQAHGVTVDDVVRATGEAVSLQAGGFLDTPNQRLAITHAASVRVARDLEGIVVSSKNGAALRVGDVATVVEGFPQPIGDAVINNGPGLLLIVEKQLGANTLQVTRDVEAALEDLKPALAGVEVDPAIFRPATFIEMSLQNLSRALLVGCVLVVLVLLVFLADWRTALISSTAIPLSLLAAGLLLHYRGGTLDTMVLAGLVIALGEVVDDAIIDVENIVRRLRLNSQLPNPQSAIRVVLDASMEVRSAVLYGSLIVVVVFVPVFMLEGLAGAFFRPLALSYVLAILASLAVALTVTPALALLLLPQHLHARESRLVGGLKERYRRMLPAFVDRPKTALGSLAVMLILTGATVPFLGEEFLPNFREYDFLMHWVEKPGTSLEAMRRITERASRELMDVPGVKNFGSHIGRAEVADEVVGPNFTELWISLDPSVDYEATVSRIQSIVDGYPGLYRDLLTYLRERIKEVLTGASATIVVRVYGPELEQLQAQAQTVRTAIADVKGIADLTVQAQVVVPKVEVRFDPDRAAAFGLTPGQVRTAAATLVQGTKVGEFYEDQRLFDVVVWGAPEVRRNLDAVRALQVPVANGGLVPLGSVAHVEVTPTPNEITRENGSRRIDVTSNVRGRNLGAVARDIQSRLASLSFQQGYYAEILGEYAERQASSTRLTLLGIGAVVAIFLILLGDFGSGRLATLVFLTLPFALVGAIVAALVTGAVLSLGSLVGLVTVIGISARNGIMLVSHYRHLEQAEGVPFGRELVFRGSEERLAPILMTALATGLALVPIVLGGSRAGYEIEHPLAVVILGGLVTSTLLNLFIVPALYLKYGRSATPVVEAGL
ncbi:MAG TPA: efflux RND transporter permease subunit [Vicinamibacterales bacterium]|nr:efflux RND transporter permease subunit [Vicinamibacterales bacterium]